MRSQAKSITIKPVGSRCNLRCRYCFYLDKGALYEAPVTAHRMSEATLERLIREMFAYSDAPTFVWHGGEPTLLGVDFFARAVALQKKNAAGRNYANAIQTNGTRLNQRWVDFLKAENFLVGVSLDGPAHVHNRYRQDPQGNGTFQTVIENIQQLLAAEVPVNVLATVNDYSVQYAQEVYRFFKGQNLMFMQFIPVLETDKTTKNRLASYSVGAESYGFFLSRLFQLWLKDFDFKQLKQKTSIRFFDSVVKSYLGMMPDHCAFQKKCDNALVVEHNGDIFSCDYLVSGTTKIGNLHQCSLAEAAASPVHAAFIKQKVLLEEKCLNCEWLSLCYGGCVKDRLYNPNDPNFNYFCRSYRFFFQKSAQQFKRLARLYQQHYLRDNR